ncbi:hypothetical protein PHLCEN_2v11446 [Hermanssonia centrifuga]|uniref:Protein kinase domain-containing protein n=1 Tax=Hermanssonia centrifuga TaxID=98765 RepID=A0A2R6NJX8_9APHY|nr:hypothetical protein PHLCEN_2v11446 [Hermanssonia centrifuga]
MAEIKTTVKSQRDDVSSTVHPAHELDSEERFWRDLQPWLEKCGYLLRPRYHPGWVASWVGTKKKWYDCEDGHTGNTLVLDAIRVSDGTAVGLKQLEVGQEHGSNEIDIVLFFSSETLAKDTRNHCVPIYEVLQVPDNDNMRILVMPLLRDYNDPQIQTVGEAVEFFHQMFEGLYFMHENHIAHRDCHSLNIMMDPKPLYPIMYHPAEDDMKQDFSGRVKHLTRTAHPVKYYWIDFGLSRKYDPDGPPPLETDFISGDKTIPEFQGQDKAYDPFPTIQGDDLRWTSSLLDSRRFVPRCLGQRLEEGWFYTMKKA